MRLFKAPFQVLGNLRDAPRTNGERGLHVWAAFERRVRRRPHAPSYTPDVRRRLNAELRSAIAQAKSGALSDFGLAREYAMEQISALRASLRGYLSMLLQYGGADPLVDPSEGVGRMQLAPFFEAE